MLEVKVTITLAPEVMSILKGLMGGISIPRQASYEPHISNKAIEQPEEPKPESKQQEQEPKQQEEKQLEPLTEEPSITVEELRALTSKGAKKDKAAVKKILEGFETKSVSTLDKEHYQAYYDKIKELV